MHMTQRYKQRGRKANKNSASKESNFPPLCVRHHSQSKMRKNSCLYDHCKKNLLDHEFATLTRAQKDHVRRYHRSRTHTIGLKDVVFRFRRDPSQHSEYVCVCGKLLSSYEGLDIHVLGCKRTSSTQAPCWTISNKATEIATTKEICDDDKVSINYWPVELVPQSQDRDKQERGLENNIDELDHDEEIVTDEPNSRDVIVDEDAEGSDRSNDYQQILHNNERALDIAILTLEQARNDIRKLRIIKNKKR